MSDIIRIKKDKNFSIVYNEVFQRKDVSWKAKGIMAYLLTLPDDWKVHSSEISSHSSDGKAAFQSGWNELKKLGYVYQEKLIDNDTKKIIGWQTTVQESVKNQNPKNQKLENQKLENQNLDFQNLENRPILNTNKLKTNELNTNKENMTIAEQSPSHSTTKKDELKADFEKLWKLYPNKKGKKVAYTAYKSAIKDGTTNRQIQDGIQAYCKQIDMNHISPEYIKHGSTYFRQRAWEDDYSIEEKEEGPYANLGF